MADCCSLIAEGLNCLSAAPPHSCTNPPPWGDEHIQTHTHTGGARKRERGKKERKKERERENENGRNRYNTNPHTLSVSSFFSSSSPRSVISSTHLSLASSSFQLKIEALGRYADIQANFDRVSLTCQLPETSETCFKGKTS